MPDILAIAQDYITHGLSVFPVEPGGKRPDFRHIESQDPYWQRFATAEELSMWFFVQPNTAYGETPNMGIACGAISGNLFVLDFDDHNWYSWWLSECPWTLRKTRVAKTPKGHHVYLRCTDKEVPSTSARGHVDLKAAGGYVVAPPSYNAERQASYSWLNPAVTEIGEVDSTWLNTMWQSLLRSQGWDETRTRINQREAITSVVHEGEGRNTRATQLAGSWMRQFGADAIPMLEFWNERCCLPPLDGVELQRIVAHVSRYVTEDSGVARAGSLVDQMQEVVE